ncbi:MAG TPA: FIST N-terminal domain-containing protein [Anaerolineaceae bacterium]|nr:FIST N-terminal domain-containing protein [Anaerolineaceae bacterium]HPN53297.1 FIST N-terminal domain-containing protein [Anaerolineaceae bacterium]
MKVEQSKRTIDGWVIPPMGKLKEKAQWVLVFGSPAMLTDQKSLLAVQAAYPAAQIMGCSTAGEICDVHVADETLVVTAVYFEHTRLEIAHAEANHIRQSGFAGEALGRVLNQSGLTHVFVLSDGLTVNGSELVNGLMRQLPAKVAVTGGLAGDGVRFRRTYVSINGESRPNYVSAVGFYGNHLKVGYGSVGGWDPFGAEWTITRSEGSILYELDGISALNLYKRYLGDEVAGLPASALLFPLSLEVPGADQPVVRTILAVDETNGTMTFAGDMPVGARARLMKANFERLVEGANTAAKISRGENDTPADLAILISCVGRKLVLKQRVEEEVETVREMLGPAAVMTGFYSYGEISPFKPGVRCALHNQTMTVTTFTEI